MAGPVAVESAFALGRPKTKPIPARGQWELVWLRFKRDRLAVTSAFFMILLVLAAFAGAPIARHVLGHGPNSVFIDSQAVSPMLEPAGPLTRVHYKDKDRHPHHTFLVLGAANTLGQDEFLRLLYGARMSLEVASLSTLGVMIVAIVLGSVAGYFRGWIDGVISKLLEATMVFPAFLFVISLAATVGPRLDGITLGIFGRGVLVVVFVFTIFGWFYPARIIRAQVLSIREKEYVEAARMTGASEARILRAHVLPHLASTIIVYSSLVFAGFVLGEAGLSATGMGVQPPDSSWGNLLGESTQYYLASPLLVLWPGLMILLTTLACNLLGDGLRDAVDPRGTLLAGDSD